MSETKTPEWRDYGHGFLHVRVGPESSMTAPQPDLEWLARYGSEENVVGRRMVMAEAIASYRYLVESCTKDEAWRRLKLIREAMEQAAKETPDAD